MELLIALIGGIVAFVALGRTGTLRQRLDAASWKISDLDREIADLRRELAQVLRPAAQQSAAATSAVISQVAEPTAAPRPASAPVEASRPMPPPTPPKPPSEAEIRFVPGSQAAVVSTPQLSMKQAAPTQAIPPIKTVADVGIPKPVANMTASPPPPPGPVFSARVETGPDTVPTPRPVAAPAPMPRQTEQPQYVYVPPVPRFATLPSAPPGKSFAERLRSTLPFEELLGMNLFAKIGIILLVFGFALLGRVALISM